MNDNNDLIERLRADLLRAQRGYDRIIEQINIETNAGRPVSQELWDMEDAQREHIADIMDELKRLGGYN